MATDGERCLKCGSSDLIGGAVVWNAPLRFKPEGAGSFRRGEEVAAMACDACGFVELRLDRPGRSG